MTWEACVDEIDKTILIAAGERGWLTELEKKHILKMSERAVVEAGIRQKVRNK